MNSSKKITTTFLLKSVFALIIMVATVSWILYYTPFTTNIWVNIAILLTTFLSLVLTVQGIFNLSLMLYAWQHPDNIDQNRSPRIFARPSYTFTAIVPARHEAQVIGDTIRAVSRINYPLEMTEVLVVCRVDDIQTIQAANEAIESQGQKNVRVITFDGFPINKPHGLNIALPYATHDIVCVFDAEDEPHKEIYNIVNTVYLKDSPDIVQSGVQLINFKSSWFSSLNVLEYFFWFKSCLQYFASAGIIPLGGNTVFFKRPWLQKVGGWDQECLTEDADIGIKLSLAGAKIRVVYDAEHATQEETPPNLKGFIKQRTRWNQGFMQIIQKGEWKKLPTIKQRLLALYVLGWPQLQALLFLYLPVSLITALLVKLPVLTTIISLLPLYILFLQCSVAIIGLFEFTREYKLHFPLYYPFKLLLSFLPYQMVLGYASFRSIQRNLLKSTTWEKTEHINAHRAKQ